MAQVCEMIMLVCFGLSWPFNIIKSLRARTAKGKSLFFEVFLLIGYIFGIVRKILMFANGNGHDFLFYLSWFFYVLNFIEISIDVALYFRNKKLDAAADAAVAK